MQSNAKEKTSLTSFIMQEAQMKASRDPGAVKVEQDLKRTDLMLTMLTEVRVACGVWRVACGVLVGHSRTLRYTLYTPSHSPRVGHPPGLHLPASKPRSPLPALDSRLSTLGARCPIPTPTLLPGRSAQDDCYQVPGSEVDDGQRFLWGNETRGP